MVLTVEKEKENVRMQFFCGELSSKIGFPVSSMTSSVATGVPFVDGGIFRELPDIILLLLS